MRDLAAGDVVHAVAATAETHPIFRGVIERSGHVTVRLIGLRDGPLGGDWSRASAPFTALGVYAEGMAQYAMLALDIEPDAPMNEVITVLRDGVANGSWEYEEGRVTDDWVRLTNS